MPPPLDLDCLDCRASIDYLTVVIREKLPAMPSKLKCLIKWHKDKGDSVQLLTLHDPAKADIATVLAATDNPMLFRLELAVDFKPKPAIPEHDREALLNDTFVAIAARFRPEDMTPWGYGTRGGLTGPKQKPNPFHQRLPGPNEELIYGHRGDYLQSKLYLKTVDQGAALPRSEYRVRTELTLKRGALMEYNLHTLDDLVGYGYRAKFTKHFRIVSGARLREVGNLTTIERDERQRRLDKAWGTAGVGKFAISPELPPETNKFASAQIKARAKNQLPLDQYVLERHQAANAKIGDAFKKLQLRMAR
jgi:hypothetical protein